MDVMPEQFEGTFLRVADRDLPPEMRSDYVCYDCGHSDTFHSLHGMWEHCKQCEREGRMGVGGLGKERILNWGFFLPKEDYDRAVALKGGHQTVFTPIGIATRKMREIR